MTLECAERSAGRSPCHLEHNAICVDGNLSIQTVVAGVVVNLHAHALGLALEVITVGDLPDLTIRPSGPGVKGLLPLLATKVKLL